MIPLGFQFSGVRCGLKNRRNDVGLLVSDRPAKAAGVFTTNQVRAACVDVSREAIADGTLRAIVVNSGNANCCTGEQGARDARKMVELAAKALSFEEEDVAVASTGVIGHLLDMSKVEKGIAEAAQALGTDPSPFKDAILTTDLVEKEASVEVGGVRIYGVAKGSGMIAPNMATMLAFVATDADVSGIDIQGALKRSADVSFNRMTVDGDTSTNDTLILMANGASGIAPDPEAFQKGLDEVMVSLAKQVARDGEGATKLVEVRVSGTNDPVKIARTIGDSPLVKTAMFGCDPNWGRVLMAAGRAGVAFDPKDAVLHLSAGGEDHLLFEHGAPAAFDAKRVSTALKADHVVIDLKLGEGEPAIIYTCDLGYGYVRINAEYHT
ncbi:bifunctional glutamate N-acetyltransferase/amino-acid acetyltransferase ArgJ [soil metagenome]